VRAQEVLAENPVKKNQGDGFPIKKADLIHDFGSEMKCSFPAQREGLTEWKAEIGNWVQDPF